MAYEIITPLRLCVRSEIDLASRAIQFNSRPDASAGRNDGKHGLILATCFFGPPSAVPNEFSQLPLLPGAEGTKRCLASRRPHDFWRATSQPRDRLGRVPWPQTRTVRFRFSLVSKNPPARHESLCWVR